MRLFTKPTVEPEHGGALEGLALDGLSADRWRAVVAYVRESEPQLQPDDEKRWKSIVQRLSEFTSRRQKLSPKVFLLATRHIPTLAQRYAAIPEHLMDQAGVDGKTPRELMSRALVHLDDRLATLRDESYREEIGELVASAAAVGDLCQDPLDDI